MFNRQEEMLMSKILVIEDDKEINRLICEYLTESGYELISATNGIAGKRFYYYQKTIKNENIRKIEINSSFCCFSIGNEFLFKER